MFHVFSQIYRESLYYWGLAKAKGGERGRPGPQAMRTYAVHAKMIAPHHTKAMKGTPTTFPTADEEPAWHAHAHKANANSWRTRQRGDDARLD